jgi:hypothetical protein
MVYIKPSNQIPLGFSPRNEEEAVQQASQEPSKLQQWKEQHKVEKHAGTGILTYLIRKIALVASAIILAPIVLPIALLYNLAVSLKEKYTISRKPDSVLTAIRKMKAKEESDKFKTLNETLTQVLGSFKTLSPAAGAKELITNLSTRLTDPAVEQNRGTRHILRTLSRKEPFNPAWITALSDPEIVKTLDFNSLGIFPEEFAMELAEKYPKLDIDDVRGLDWKKLTQKVEKRKIAPEKIDKEVRKFEISLKELLAALKNQKASSNQTSANREVIAALRKALSSPVYQALKQDSTEPSIKLLHRLASDIWNKAPSMEAYCGVGENIMQHAKIESEGEELDGKKLAEQLAASHKELGKHHYTAHGLLATIDYTLTHPRQMLGALASEGGVARHVPGSVGLDEYDSHGTLSNNPSLQGVTTVNLEDGHTATIHNCYGGSPTIGDHKVAPEFKAVLQAAENNQVSQEELRDTNIPMIVNYNNLQNLDKKHGEGPRSRTIMLLNQKYPLSFRGTTFSKDSDLYLMKTTESVVWKGEPSKFGEIMQDQLERSFDTKEKGHGFYFYGTLEKWQPIFQEVIANANAHFETLRNDDPTFWESLKPEDLQGAYQEYVYSLLNAVTEMESANALKERGIEDPLVMAITACKENIDRGGMENTKYLYTRLTNTNKEDRLPLILGAMHSRALSARDRVILKKRMPQVLDFMKTTSPDDFRNNQMKLFVALGYQVTASDYHPHLPTASDSTIAAPAA